MPKSYEQCVADVRRLTAGWSADDRACWGLPICESLGADAHDAEGFDPPARAEQLRNWWRAWADVCAPALD